ncbi:bZIP transcription factor TRAB1-like [Zingiber officinale]|uniref:bZIP transcription factor TRAB1-like n=1 Tax=Zingiber officinale TaxID=94328 RepID=UPI001C4B420B|nr:bZIP transcription factor TRAB1-like [Zingiber officinale]XP_042399971.1 bZIP transcription factor TRAB1-like [Zingiber officinale]
MNFNQHLVMEGGCEVKGGGGGSGLARLASVYSLTFDEFQSSLGGFGKDFGSMNMDELLKNIWTAEESQAMAGAVAPGVGEGGIQGQGSFTLPRTLSHMTVDEIWRDLVCPAHAAPAPAAVGVSQQHRHPTLGEITLEEFLVKAGVVKEEPATILPPRPIGNTTGNVIFNDLPVVNNATDFSLGFSPAGRSSRGSGVSNQIVDSAAVNLAMIAANEAMPFAVPRSVVDLGNQAIRRGGLAGVGEAGMNGGFMPGAVALGAGAGTVTVASPVNHARSHSFRKRSRDQSSVSSVPYPFSGGLRGRKSSAVEKVFERRQRRMIKNRESAARSRARKQAYTMELETEVAELKELNQELQKKQAKMMEMQKNQVLRMINQQPGPKKPCLRRTQTGPW